MPILQDSRNPFKVKTPYDELGVDPFASAEEISNHLARLRKEAQALPAEERDQRVAALDDAGRMLKNMHQRILLNATIYDRLNKPTAAALLDEVAGPPLALPELGAGHLVLEGECPDFAAGDFHEVPRDPVCELDLAELGQLLCQQPSEPHFLFES